MKINIKTVKKPKTISQNRLVQGRRFSEQSSYYNPLFAEWGKVIKAYSESVTVDVELVNGTFLKKIPVRSIEWAGAGTNGYGERDLPPENCRVLILFPGGILENGIIICSALELYSGSDVGEKQRSELMVSGKEDEALIIREGKKTTLKINGAEVIVNTDGSIEVTPKAGKDIKLAGGTTLGANNLISCIFSGALHCTDAQKKVKVP